MTVAAAEDSVKSSRKPFYKHLYYWVIFAIVCGVLVGYFFPDLGAALQPVGTSFVNMIRMVIAPVIFCTVVVGIASIGDMKAVGRVGVKALVYFEIVSTVALVLGMVVMNVTRPGDGVNADPSTIKVSEDVGKFIQAGKDARWYDFIFDIFPTSVVGAFSEGNVIQVLFFAVIFAFALLHMGEKGQSIVAGINRVGKAFFGVIRIVMYAAPVGAFGAMAFTIGKYGIDTLTSLGQLVVTFYLTSLFFVIVVLGAIAAAIKVNIFKLLRYIKDELLIVLGTSSSESVLPQLMRKLEHLGASRPVVGLTVPAGYSFNLDGTAIYLTLSSLFIAQAVNVDLSLGQQLGILAVLLLTSKGAAGVTGSGFIVLSATLSTAGGGNLIPVSAVMLVFGVDRFMSECRALTNLCGNTLACLVVAKWEGQLDVERVERVLNGHEDEMEILEGDEEPFDEAGGRTQTAAAQA